MIEVNILLGHAVQLLATPDLRYDPCGILKASALGIDWVCLVPWGNDTWMKTETEWECVQSPLHIDTKYIKGILDLEEHGKNPKNSSENKEIKS
jgi:hypothetical protein